MIKTPRLGRARTASCSVLKNSAKLSAAGVFSSCPIVGGEGHDRAG